MTWYDYLFHFLFKPRFEVSIIGLLGAVIAYGWVKKNLDKWYLSLMGKYIKGHRYIYIPHRCCPYYDHRDEMGHQMPEYCFKAELAKRVFGVTE
jgi:hypothetical protein